MAALGTGDREFSLLAGKTEGSLTIRALMISMGSDFPELLGPITEGSSKRTYHP